MVRHQSWPGLPFVPVGRLLQHVALSSLVAGMCPSFLARCARKPPLQRGGQSRLRGTLGDLRRLEAEGHAYWPHELAGGLQRSEQVLRHAA